MNKRTIILVLAIVLVIGLMAGLPAYSQYQTKVYFTDGGDTLVVDTGGKFQIESGATVEISDATFLETNGGMTVNDGDLVVAASSTPVFTFADDGSVTGNLLQYDTPGDKIVCGTQNVTGAATATHGLATPVRVVAALGADFHEDHANLSYTNASGVVTLKVWKFSATPAAAETAVPVSWCVIGH